MSRNVAAADAVVEHAGGAYQASLNSYTDGTRRVCTVQVDTWVYVVGDRNFSVARYDLGEWIHRTQRTPDLHRIDADTAEEAWELLQYVRNDALLWQCGACDAWIFTTDRPRIGVLACSTCGNGGVDFRHADRHVGRS